MLKRVLFALLGVSVAAQANVVITGTRAIYPAEQSSLNIQLNNVGTSPSLVQSWLDRGDAETLPNAVKVPFIITPPVTRIDPKQGQTLRVTYTGTEVLPKDRESLFYLNVLDIPPKPTEAERKAHPNFLQLSLRSRIKFFYRPDNLSITPNDAYQSLNWSVQGGGVMVENNSPYYITYNYVAVGKHQITDAAMVAPFSKHTFPIKGAAKGAKVVWSVINDFGGDTKGESILK